MIEVANRLKQVEEYYFSKKLREVAFLKSQGKPIINLGIGSHISSMQKSEDPQAVAGWYSASCWNPMARWNTHRPDRPKSKRSVGRF